MYYLCKLVYTSQIKQHRIMNIGLEFVNICINMITERLYMILNNFDPIYIVYDVFIIFMYL